MATSDAQNPPKAISKSARKKAAKNTAVTASSSPEPTESVTVETGAAHERSSSAGPDDESPYIKELEKNIRNTNKKITNASRVDNVLAENPDKSLDELIAARKINADQKAQILKKPALQAAVIQYEEQLAQYKKFDQEYKSRAQADKTALEKAFTHKAEQNLSEAIAAAKAEAVAESVKAQHADFLVISQFLRLAAARRADEDVDPATDENQALEGVLLQVYSGDQTAVASMIKLITGADEPTYATTGEPLTTTYAQVKAVAISQAPPYDPTEDNAEESPAVETDSYPVESDPTIANAGLTEIDDLPSSLPIINGHGDAHAEADAVGIPQNAGIDEGASNEAAETKWDVAKNEDMSPDQEGWVEVPRDVSETDNGIDATPAAKQAPQATTSSWAEETSQNATQADSASRTNGDGFHEVARNRGRDGPRGRGGRGNGEGHKGRGGGGFNGRGRGRGGQRGGANSTPRGQSRPVEA